jgi:hypothetical protein
MAEVLKGRKLRQNENRYNLFFIIFSLHGICNIERNKTLSVYSSVWVSCSAISRTQY